MGGATSVPLEVRMTENAPVYFGDLDVDGNIGHRDEFDGGKPSYYRSSYKLGNTTLTSMYTSIQKPRESCKEDDDDDDGNSSSNGKQQSALQLQAASHWHKIMDYAVDAGKLERPICPECLRNNHTGPNCRLCGIEVALAVATASNKNSNKTIPTSDDSNLKLQWNATSQRYDRVYLSELAHELVTYIKDAASPDDYKARKSSSLNSKQAKDERDRDDQVGDFNYDRKSMQKVIAIMKDVSEEERKQNYSLHSIRKVSMTTEEIQAQKEKIMRELSKEEKREQYRSRIDKRKMIAEKEKSNLLSALKGVVDSYASKHGKKKRRDSKNMSSVLDPDNDSDSDNDAGDNGGELEDDYDDVDFDAPMGISDVPDVTIELKSRTSTSITLIWDVNTKALIYFEKIHETYGNSNTLKEPTYEVMHRQHFDMSVSLDKREVDALWIPSFKRAKERSGTVHNLLPNHPYVFRCRRLGWTDWGSSIVIRTGPGAPSAPRAIAAKEVTSSSILITWQIPEKDNGLPINEYTVLIKPWGGNFEEVYKGKDRVYLATNMQANMVHIFEVKASNKIGYGPSSDRLAVRTLPQGAADMTPWVEAIDEKTGKLFYRHPKSNEISWKLPKGALIDDAMSLKSKRMYLTRQIYLQAQEACIQLEKHSYVLNLSVKRDNLLEQSLQSLYKTPSVEINAGPIRIKFENEDGLDAGGLAKDWYNSVAKSLVEGGTGLYQVTEYGVIVDIRAGLIHKPSESRWLFKALGIFLAKTLIDNQTLGILFSPYILSLLCNKKLTLQELECCDDSFYKGLKWVEENVVDDADLTFSASYDLLGTTEVVDLIDNGRNIAVVEDNKEEYIELMVEWLTRGRFEPAISYMLEGFHRHVPMKLFKHFSYQELQIVLGGQVSIDISEMCKNVEYNGGYHAQSNIVIWLWIILEKFDQEKLKKFLGFLTGCSSLPMDGLHPPILITYTDGGSDDIWQLPCAHTCFNQLIVPDYSSIDLFEEKLLYALDHTGSEFHIS